MTRLLAEADARAGVEGHEDERVLHEVLLEATIDEAVRIKLHSYDIGQYVEWFSQRSDSVPSGPQISLRRCMINGV